MCVMCSVLSVFDCTYKREEKLRFFADMQRATVCVAFLNKETKYLKRIFQYFNAIIATCE